MTVTTKSRDTDSFTWFRRPELFRPLYPIEEFRAAIGRECERADRYNLRFSLAIFEVPVPNGNSIAVRRLVRALYRRFRNIDDLGWFGPGQIGVILPYTPSDGAWKLAEDICGIIASISSPPAFTVYTYPSHRWPRNIHSRMRHFFSLAHWNRRAEEPDSLLSGADFMGVLERERERADRSGNMFSLVLIDVSSKTAPETESHQMIHCMTTRLRDTDEIGWFDSHHIGMLLPYSDANAADTTVASLSRDLGLDLSGRFAIFTYPGNWPPWQPEEVTSKDMEHSGRAHHSSHTSSPGPATDAWQAAHAHSRGITASGQPVREIERFFVRPIPWWKRIVDITGAGLGLILLAPLFASIAVAVKLLSPGPVFYRQKRAGLGGKPFTIYKFRSMVVDADSRKAGLKRFNERTGPAFKMTNDPRVTPVGRFLRKWSLDELPQMYNVLRGDMSLVGPRPLPIEEDQGVDQWHAVRRHIRPGITCLWQVSARHTGSFDDWVRLDIEYTRRQSFLLDFKILFMTFGSVFRPKGTS